MNKDIWSWHQNTVNQYYNLLDVPKVENAIEVKSNKRELKLVVIS